MWRQSINLPSVLLTCCVQQHMPASARVSAYFYLGRTEVSSGHIEQGLQLLEQAFQECPRDSNNMQTILRFLVPVSSASNKRLVKAQWFWCVQDMCKICSRQVLSVWC